MTLTKIVNSKLVAMLIGAWTTYCAGIGDYGGAVFLLFFYSLMLWDLNTKKPPVLGTPMANRKHIKTNIEVNYIMKNQLLKTISELSPNAAYWMGKRDGYKAQILGLLQ